MRVITGFSHIYHPDGSLKAPSLNGSGFEWWVEYTFLKRVGWEGGGKGASMPRG